MGKNKLKVTGFRLEDEVLEKLNIIADKNRRSRNQEVDYALRKYIEEYEKASGTIKIGNIGQNNGTINM